MHTPVRVLFLCDANSARSQMAEALLRKVGGNAFGVHSAGLDPKPLHPFAVKVMREIDLDIADQQSKHLNEFMDTQFDYVITLCDQVRSSCAAFMRDNVTEHWQCEDPLEAKGSDEQKLAVFRRVRDEIRQKVETWVGKIRPG